MDDYIAKPIEPETLERKLYQWLKVEVEKAIDAPATIIQSEKNLTCWHKESALQRLVNKESLLLLKIINPVLVGQTVLIILLLIIRKIRKPHGERH